MKRLTRLSAILATLASLCLFLTFGGSTAFAASAISNAPAQALATCSGNGCNGQDPSNSGCWDSSAYIVHGVSVRYGAVYLWYSPTCKTNWAETFQSSGTNYIANANITRSDGLHYSGTWYSYDVWSPMVYSPVLTANACGSINNAPGGCTGYY